MGRGQGVVHLGQRVVAFLAMVVLTWATVGCAKPIEPTVLLSEPTAAPNRLIGQIAEVSPPETLETLKQIIDAYTPQVRILSPRPGEVLESTSVAVRVQVRGLPLFKDDTWQLGPHLHVFLDDQPYQAVYDLSEPLVFDDLAPGTHTLRVFASRPWHESFKNQGAFDQRTFHVFAPTPQNEVNASAPLLTYSRPQGTYGAEPIMLDFYLTNAPLHLSAQEDAKDDLHDWRIRCTVNGQSFVFDQWQPIYLKGFQPGRNWVQLELIDETGRPIDNRFNNTVRVFDYQPGGTDTLSRLVRGELDLRAVASIIDPTYSPPTPPTPVPATVPSPQPSEMGSEDTTPEVEEKTTPEPASPQPDDVKPNPFLRPAAEAPTDQPPTSQATDPEPEKVTPTEGLPLSAPPAVLAPTKADVFDDGEEQAEDDASDQADVLNAPDDQPMDDPSGDESLVDELLVDEPLPDKEQTNQDAPAAVSPGQVDAAAEGSTNSTQPTGAQAWVNRLKAWQQQRQSSAPIAPDDATRDSIPVYQVPPVSPEPEASAPPAESELPRVMPELIEPYLTEPYLTQPRIEMLPTPQPLEEEPFHPSDSVVKGDDPPEQAQAPDQAPEALPPEPPEPLRPGLQRPYI